MFTLRRDHRLLMNIEHALGSLSHRIASLRPPPTGYIIYSPTKDYNITLFGTTLVQYFHTALQCTLFWAFGGVFCPIGVVTPYCYLYSGRCFNNIQNPTISQQSNPIWAPHVLSLNCFCKHLLPLNHKDLSIK